MKKYFSPAYDKVELISKDVIASSNDAIIEVDGESVKATHSAGTIFG